MTTVALQENPWSVIYDQRGSQSVKNHSLSVLISLFSRDRVNQFVSW